MPDEERLPPGPRRDLAAALHDLYALAGKPAARTISSWIRGRDNLPGTLSHEGVSAVLRGTGTPRWANLESLVRVLVEQQRVGSTADVDTVVVRIHALWRTADGGPAVLPDPSLASPASREDGSNEEPITHRSAPQAGRGSGSPSGELTSGASAQRPLIRWNPRQRTLDVFDRQMAIEVIKEVGGDNDQA